MKKYGGQVQEIHMLEELVCQANNSPEPESPKKNGRTKGKSSPQSASKRPTKKGKKGQDAQDKL